ncbi:CRTAC1 family protein [Pelagicoccus sp. SDUM812005]|uniref:CRTAC1 family protein n=1 Tax=Pelagicoccus sp. SDUM812005 TaxID=3041257 RepID=UPI0028106F7F|nr:CRTAC1 family protein [Pelagicoccus sp. SDUM812005]MDQ8180976.1 CRTAC1 family protein [Pelagicoccus sp. SDUM812005]
MPHLPKILRLSALALFPALSFASVEKIVEQRQSLDASVWENERLAQEYETAFIELWDEMRRYPDDQSPALRNFPFETLRLPRFQKARSYPEGVDSYLPAPDSEQSHDQSAFHALLDRYQSQGFRIEQSEWHHAAFQAPKADSHGHSTFTFALHVQGPASTRYIVKGKLAVDWQERRGTETPLPRHIAHQDIAILARSQVPSFAHTTWLESKKNTTPYGIVLVHDLNQDGLPDIAFPRLNQLYLNKGNFQFEERTLAQFMIRGLPTAAFFADLDLDGNIEYVLSTHEAPFLFAYTLNPSTQAFDGKPFGIWKSDTPLQTGLLAVGDITGDGYPEIYLGQSAPIYEGGKIPTPYFDANDGRPAYLLKNRGNLSFVDITEETSVAQKRGRRAFTASFQDLNNDQRMDLLVTSDFSGIDIHENQNGTLVDKTDAYLQERSLFGMSHAFADFDRDGTSDLLAVGMSSTTARRLEGMGLGRDEFPQHQEMRMRIAKGNRLYYGQADGRLLEAETSNQVARSGWSWGNSTFDFNHDSYPDIFIANGYLSRSTARDYCSNFWTHDIYTEPVFSEQELDSFFNQFGPEALVGGNQMGWNPFEKDHLYLNIQGQEFLNIAYLLGISHGGDGRAVLDVDLDRDGKQDILLVEQDSMNSIERVHLYKNQHRTDNNWIGIDLQQTPGHALFGARVTLVTDEYTTERVYTHGESYSSQRPATLNFGIPRDVSIKSVQVTWPDGARTTLDAPETGAYHPVKRN